MEILLSGGTGYIGRELGIHLVELGHKVTVLTRNIKSHTNTLPYPCRLIKWNGKTVTFDSNYDAVINLAGESISSARWTSDFKQKLEQSRIFSTRALVKECLRKKNIKVFIQISATGYYGHCLNKDCVESLNSGTDFLSRLCKSWENEIFQLKSSQIRTVVLRLGVVLGKESPFLKKIERFYAANQGSVIGNGDHWLPWIHLKDVLRIINFSLTNHKAEGVYNTSGLVPATFSSFHKKMQKLFGYQILPKIPAAIAKLLLGEQASLALTSIKSRSEKIKNIGYSFQFPTLENSMDDIYPTNHPNLLGTQILTNKQWIAQPMDKLWSFFSDTNNLEKITPPWLHFKIIGKTTQPLQKKSQISYKLKLHGLPFHWKSEICEWQPKHKFTDQQIRGPYKIWHHQHILVPLAQGTLCIDLVHYSLPLSFLSTNTIGFLVTNDLEKIFKYRKSKIAAIFN